MAFGDGIAVGLVCALLRPDGRMYGGRIVEAALRGALLVDLAGAGRLTEADAGIDLDTSPTGFLPADRMLADAEKNPGRALEEWIAHGPDVGESLVDVALETGRLARRRHLGSARYEVLQPWPSGVADDPGRACVVLLLDAAGLAPAGSVPDGAFANLIGDRAWILDTATETVAAERAFVRAVGNDSTATMMIGGI